MTNEYIDMGRFDCCGLDIWIGHKPDCMIALLLGSGELALLLGRGELATALDTSDTVTHCDTHL